MAFKTFLVLIILVFANSANAMQHLSRTEALSRARAAMTEDQIDNKRYELDEFVSRLSDDKKTWIFHFVLPSGPPDTGYFVEVDNGTGVATVRSDF